MELLLAQECDVWLLTEVRADVSLTGFESHLTAAKMAPRGTGPASTPAPHSNPGPTRTQPAQPPLGWA